MRLYDTHAHLDFDDYKKDRASVLESCFKAGVEKIINVGINAESTEKSIQLSTECNELVKNGEKYPQMKASGGYHPSMVHWYDEKVLRELLKHPDIVAIGEIGLDFYRMYKPAELQEEVFEAQIKIGMELGLPLLVHEREAHEECFAILKRHSPKKVVFHCFSGDVQFAEKVLNEGWHISITGSITYRNNTLADVVRMLPTDKFFVETDSPYLTPMPHRGQRNTPEYLTYTIQKIADILNIAPNVVAEQSYKNAEAFFGF
jgi:TatD DNase family protein